MFNYIYIFRVCKIQPNAFRTIGSLEDAVYCYFTVERVVVEIKNGNLYEKQKKIVAYCRETRKFLDYVAQQREMPEVNQLFMKLGTDSGRGSLKLCATLHPPEQVIIKGKNYGGVKKLLLLAIMFNTPETHFNLKTLFSLVQMSDPTMYTNNCCCTCDLKATGKMIGTQESSCSTPCPYCDKKKFNLRCKSSSSRTFGDIRESKANWEKKGKKLKDAAVYNNCIQDPVFTDIPDIAKIIELFPPPELHLMLGGVYKLYQEFVAIDPENVQKWLKKCHVTPDHNGTFNGNQSRKLLKNWHLLKDLFPHHQSLVNCLGALNEVVDSCFGMELKENYVAAIERFDELLIENQIEITPKLHIIVDHLIEFFDTLPEDNKHGLAYFGEQASESIHHMWDAYFSNFKCNQNSDNYENCLLRAISKFNGRAI